MKLSLYLPPTINTYWRSIGRGRVIISAKGREYRIHVFACVLTQVIPPIYTFHGRLAVSITMFPPDKRRRDLDNLLKSLLDALQHAGVYVDDSQIDDLRIVRGGMVQGGGVVVEVTQIAAPAAGGA